MLKSCYTSKLAAVLVLLMIALPAIAGKNWRTEGNSKATKAEACVAPVPEMRRNHMDMIQQ